MVFWRFDLAFGTNHGTGWRVISVGDAGGKATRRSAEGPAAAGLRGGDRSRSSAGAAGARDRLGVSRPTFFQRVHGGRWAAATTDPAGGGAVDPQAHAQPVGRGVVRALAGEPVLP